MAFRTGWNCVCLYHFDPVTEARRYETGNMNFSGIYGARQGLRIILQHYEQITKSIGKLTEYLRNTVQNTDHLQILSPQDGKTTGITLLGCKDAKKIYEGLTKNGIVVNYRNGLRISLHFYNTVDDIDHLLNSIHLLQINNGAAC